MVRCLAEDLGADINHSTLTCQNSVFVAAQNGHLGVLRYLGKAGVDMNGADKFGQTPLMMASAKNVRAAVVKWLVKAGVDTQLQMPLAGEHCCFHFENARCLRRADRLPGSQDTLLQPRLQRCGAHEVHGVQAGAVLWGGVPAGPLEGAQG